MEQVKMTSFHRRRVSKIWRQIDLKSASWWIRDPKLTPPPSRSKSPWLSLARNWKDILVRKRKTDACVGAMGWSCTRMSFLRLRKAKRASSYLQKMTKKWWERTIEPPVVTWSTHQIWSAKWDKYFRKTPKTITKMIWVKILPLDSNKISLD